MPSIADMVFPWINDTALGARMDALREKVARDASGRVLEIGAGTGLNFRHYPKGSVVTAVEPAVAMRRRAEERAREASGVAVTVIDGRAGSLPFEEASFDTAVLTFTLCSIRDPGRALREVRRVLRPGGELRLVEHVKSPRRDEARVQRWLEPVWGLAFGGCSLVCDVRLELELAGFDPGELEAVVLPLPMPVRAGLVGSARRRL